jgi:hypothetical protein
MTSLPAPLVVWDDYVPCDRCGSTMQVTTDGPRSPPVSAPVRSATEAEIDAAVTYFAGGRPEVVDLPGSAARWHVIGAGYYHWIGA